MSFRHCANPFVFQISGFSRCWPIAVALWLALGQLPVAMADTLQNVIFSVLPSTTVTFTATDSPSSPIPIFSIGQGPAGEGAVSGVDGNFLVRFDPFDHTPNSIQFRQGHGFLDVRPTGNWSPLDPLLESEADHGIDILGSGNFQVGRGAIRNEIFDLTTGVISNSGGNNFSSPSTSINVVSARAIIEDLAFGNGTNVTDFQGDVLNASSSWELSNTGSTWLLDGFVDYQVEEGPVRFGWRIDINAEAQFDNSNVGMVSIDQSGDGSAIALGGLSNPGGVTADFEGISGTTEATLSAQQLTNSAAFSLAAIQAQAEHANIAASVAAVGTPQLWDLSLIDDVGNDVDFQSVLINLAYDDTGFASGFDETTLGVWHFNSELGESGEWEAFAPQLGNAQIDTENNIISFELDNFSEVQLGIFNVPEPSGWLVSSMLIGTFGMRRRRRTT